MKMRLFFIALATFSTTWAFSNDSLANDITAQKVFLSYRSMQLLTPKPILVDALIAESCVVGPSTNVHAESKERYGVHAGVPVNFYANDVARSAIDRGAKAYSTGAVIVKEKLSPGGKVLAVGGMLKRSPGFDAANGDWEYFYGEGLKTITAGRIESCVSCHSKARHSDYVYLRKARLTP
jgi:hypothetical protein